MPGRTRGDRDRSAISLWASWAFWKTRFWSPKLCHGRKRSATSCLHAPMWIPRGLWKKTSVTADVISKHQPRKYIQHLRKTPAISLHLHLVTADGWVAWQFLHEVPEAVVCWLLYFLTMQLCRRLPDIPDKDIVSSFDLTLQRLENW